MADPYYNLRKSRYGQFYFILVASNGEVLATTEMYPTKSNAKRGLDAVSKAARTTNVVDDTDNDRMRDRP